MCSNRIDPDPDKANLCCNQTFTDRTVPDKLVLQSGWNPGDFYVLADYRATFGLQGPPGGARFGPDFSGAGDVRQVIVVFGPGPIDAKLKCQELGRWTTKLGQSQADGESEGISQPSPC